MGLLSSFRWWRARESTRRLALDVAVRAHELTGTRAYGDWAHLGTRELLEMARSSLRGAAERIRRDEEALSRGRELGAAQGGDGTAVDSAGSTGPPPPATELMEIADRLAALTSAGRGLDPAAADWLTDRFTGVLARCEIAVVDDTGPVDPARHEVVGVRPAPDDERADHIAETVRRGYEWRGRILRPQQVIAFVRRGTR